jgi:L-serine dehydratase
MLGSMFIGCHTEGKLPGGLNVQRRAFGINKTLIGNTEYKNAEEWLETIRDT